MKILVKPGAEITQEDEKDPIMYAYENIFYIILSQIIR